MELKLKKTGHDYYEPLDLAPFSCETMRETIVPDSCADIARIVETTGNVYLTGREVAGDGRISASGTVDVSVLYIPERGEGPCALRFQIPFQSYGEGPEEACQFLDICGEIHNIETRLLNPRKVLTRANLTLYPAGCRRVALELCTDSGEEGDSLQLLREQRSTRAVAAVREKEFSFVEEFPLSPGRSGGEEILSLRADVRGTDSKVIGSKLVVKGIIDAAVLYRESGGRLELLRQELPFSQILEGSGLGEEDESEVVCRLLNGECTLGTEAVPDDPHMVTLKLLLRARATVRRPEELSFLADLYSTSAPVVCQTEPLTIREDSQRQTRRLSGRELLETGTAVKAVIDTEISCGGVRFGAGGEEMEIPLRARCLYLDENDGLHSVSRTFSMTCPGELPPGSQASGWAACRGDVMASILPDGVELRFPVEVQLEVYHPGRYLCIAGVETEDTQEVTAPAPSLILRKLGGGETLWSVAKQYRTTCRAIREVNGIPEEGQVPTDRLLLIPRAR